MIFYLVIAVWALSNKIYRYIRQRHSASRVRSVRGGID